MYSALNLTKSGYYRWKSRKPSRSNHRRHILAIKIREIHSQFKKIYGYIAEFTKSLPAQGRFASVSECGSEDHEAGKYQALVCLKAKEI
jgi:hypothetical protein